MAAQLLSRYLVRPSRGLKELSQTIMMKHLVLAYCRHYHLNLPCCTVFYVLNKQEEEKIKVPFRSFSSPIPLWSFSPRD